MMTCLMRVLCGAIAILLLLTNPAQADPVGVKYSEQYAPPPSYSGTELIDRDFSGQMLRVAEFANTRMSRVNFTNANLLGAVMSASTMKDTTFHGADLTQSMMDQIPMIRVDLSDAVLVDALFLRTSFEEVNITGADFTGALLDGAQVKELCAIADGVNSKTGVATRDSLGC